jgi:hypothetical protein
MLPLEWKENDFALEPPILDNLDLDITHSAMDLEVGQGFWLAGI